MWSKCHISIQKEITPVANCSHRKSSNTFWILCTHNQNNVCLSVGCASWRSILHTRTNAHLHSTVLYSANLERLRELILNTSGSITLRGIVVLVALLKISLSRGEPLKPTYCGTYNREKMDYAVLSSRFSHANSHVCGNQVTGEYESNRQWDLLSCQRVWVFVCPI